MGFECLFADRVTDLVPEACLVAAPASSSDSLIEVTKTRGGRCAG